MDLESLSNPETSSVPSSLARALREQTRADHARIEQVPAHSALLEARLTPSVYLAQLYLYRTLLLALESAACTGPPFGRLSRLLTRDRRRAQLADQDTSELESLGVFPAPCVREPILSLAARIRAAGPDDPESIGAAYVMEGASLGARIQERLARQSMPQLQLAHRFFAGYGNDTGRMWRSFIERLDELPLREGECEAVVRGARSTFGALHTSFASIEMPSPVR
ncbi:MAG: hypothetical protein EA398_07580 [Deltaproteobacteria bacterium]|nr:MAG: hypothetical protein EA398_07580 [Deltaproteobacteria bacterium]